MSAEDNLNTVSTIYKAFGEGDVDTIVSVVADDVDWSPDPKGDDCPWVASYTKDTVPQFFAAIGENLDVLDFQVVGMGSSDNEVFVFLTWHARVKATGSDIQQNLHHYWRFDDDGKVSYYRGSEDTKESA